MHCPSWSIIKQITLASDSFLQSVFLFPNSPELDERTAFFMAKNTEKMSKRQQNS
jgi:hypothetical protein